MKSIAFSAGAALLVAGSAMAADELPLAQKSGCMACHQIDQKLVGPAYKDVAKKFAGQPNAVEELTQKVINGSQGVWGPVPMPPKGGNPSVSDEDVKKIVEWVLTLNK